MPVQVAAGAVILLCCPWVRVTGKDLRVAYCDAGVQGIGDAGVSQGVQCRTRFQHDQRTRGG